MQVIIELTAPQVESLQSFLSTQLVQVPNPITGNITNQPIYSGVEELIQKHVGQMINNAMNQYPPESVQQDLQQIQEAAARIKAQSQPSVVVAAIEQA